MPKPALRVRAAVRRRAAVGGPAPGADHPEEDDGAGNPRLPARNPRRLQGCFLLMSPLILEQQHCMKLVSHHILCLQ